MDYLDPAERNEFVDRVAQAVIDRIEERERMGSLADLVVARVFQMQKQEQEALAERDASLPIEANV